MPTKAQMAQTIEQLAAQLGTLRQEYFALNERLLSQLGESLERREPRILLVDDEDFILDCFRPALARKFAPKESPVLYATDGNSALQVLAAEKPLGLCTDITHPGPDGYNLANTAISLNPLAVIGYVHGWAHDPDHLVDFEIHKPCTMAEFTSCISTAYRIMYQRARQQLTLCARLHTTPDKLTPIHEHVRPVPKAGTIEHSLAMLLDLCDESFPNTFNTVLQEEYRRAGIPKEYRPHDFMEPILTLDCTDPGQKPLITTLARAYQHLLLTSDEFGPYRPVNAEEKSRAGSAANP